MLGRSLESDAAAEVRSHLRHSREDVFYSHSHSADGVVGFLFGFAQGLGSGGSADEVFLGVALEQIRFVVLAVVGAVGEDGAVFFVEEGF